MKKVMVGLSGGVDSTVAAALLQREGHQVIGAFVKIWQPEFIACTWEEDRLSAKRAAAHLGIPFVERDFSEIYQREVISDLVASYQRGETPNPDVWCNRFIKFGALWEEAKSLGCTHLATGHYAQNINGYLVKAKDVAKDQSYFLARLTPDDLAHTLFPLGMYTKHQVREMATTWGIPHATRPDSQGLCFVGDMSVGDLVSRYITVTPGVVRNLEGSVAGTHRGIVHYTIGQRHGFTLHVPGEHYVTAIKPEKNELYVSHDPHDAMRPSFTMREVLWHDTPPHAGEEINFEVRYHQGLQKGTVTGTRINAAIAQTVAPGQIVVFYRGTRVIGSGVVTL